MGVGVNVGEGGSGVSDGGGVKVEGRVAVTRSTVGVDGAPGFDPHAALNIRVAKARMNFILENTEGILTDENKNRLAAVTAPPRGLEPRSSAPEADTLSTELRGLALKFYHKPEF